MEPNVAKAGPAPQRWTSWEPADRCRASSGQHGQHFAASARIPQSRQKAPRLEVQGLGRQIFSRDLFAKVSLQETRSTNLFAKEGPSQSPVQEKLLRDEGDPASAGLGAGNLVTLATPSRKTSRLKLPVIQLRSKPAARDPAARPPGAKQQGQGVQETAPKAKVQICLNLSSTCSQLCQRHVCLSHSGFGCAPARKAPKWP